MSGRPMCRRCLLEELDQKACASVRQYIESLDQDLKVDAEEYEKRLAYCRQCEHLQNGICSQCGCFAEVRAVKRLMDCPMGLWLHLPKA